MRIDSGRSTQVVRTLLATVITVAAASVGAQERRPEPDAVPEVVVIGSRQQVQELSGAGYYADEAEIQSQGYDDINRVLRRAPGVYLREEDGYGLFPNISLRGVDTQRTSKLTIMEDGIPTAPAPYSAPAAYYAPTAGRMHGVEVLKGSSQIRWGPHTTGGVINYRSTPVPEGFHGKLRVAFGSDNEVRQHGWIGSSFATGIGRMGFLLETFFRHTDGYKRVDSTAAFGDSTDTGFRKSEPSFKFFWEPKGERFSRLELKVGATDLDADETYLGLTDADFDADPNRRYAASRFDNIDSNQLRSYLRYTRELTDSITIVSTGYYNRFRRNWYKLKADGEDLADPVRLACLQGTADCDFELRNNRRNYYSAGFETAAEWLTETGDVEHEWTAGFRLHRDRVERNQTEDRYTQVGGAVVGVTPEGECSGGCRKQTTDALSLFLQNRMQLARLTLQPGVRVETIRAEYQDGPGAPDQHERLTAWSPGISGRFALTDAWSLFGGVHRGIFLPSPRALVRGNQTVETSTAYELGARFVPTDFSNVEVTAFYTDFDDLLVVDNVGSGGNGDDQNVGDVNSYGVELLGRLDVGAWRGWSFANPWHVAVTLTKAELDGDARTSDFESIFAGGKDGNDVPYIPSYAINVGTGIETDRYALYVDANFVDSTYSTASNSSASVNPETGVPDLTFGETDAYVVLDVSGRYRLTDRAALTLNVYNLADEEYIVSRHPIGPRPGRPRSALVGAELEF